MVPDQAAMRSLTQGGPDSFPSEEQCPVDYPLVNPIHDPLEQLSNPSTDPENQVCSHRSHTTAAKPQIDRSHLTAEASHKWRNALAALIIYSILAYLAYVHTSPLSSPRLPICACGDAVQEVWYLSWSTFAITHAHNLFFSNWINYPSGVNLAINTSMPLLGILAAPLTLLLGPIAAYNSLLIIAFASSGIAMYILLRHWNNSWVGAFVGGLLYGFGPYMISQGNAHLLLTFVPIPPLIFLLLDKMIFHDVQYSIPCGLALGLLGACQYFISAEIFAMTVIVASIGILFLILAHPSLTFMRLRRSFKGFLIGSSLCGLLIAYPVWFALYGPEHVIGPPQPLNQLALYPGDLLGGIIPTVSQLVGPASLKQIGDRLAGGNIIENGMYLGIPLLVVLCLFTVFFWRIPIFLFTQVMMVSSYILSLGPRLTILGHVVGVSLPFEVLYHLSLLQDILPIRFSLFTELFAACALGIGLDCIGRKVLSTVKKGKKKYHRYSLRWASTCFLVGFALFPLVPQLPYAGASSDVARGLVGNSSRDILPGSVVLTYPYPVNPSLEGMLLQAMTGMKFKIVGGYSFVPLPTGRSTAAPTELTPVVVEEIFLYAYSGISLGGKKLSIDAETVTAERLFLHRYQIQTILLYDVGKNPALAARYLVAALGPPELIRSNLRVWFHVQKVLRDGSLR